METSRPVAVFCAMLCGGIVVVRIADGGEEWMMTVGDGLTVLMGLVLLVAYRLRAEMTATMAMWAIGLTLGLGVAAHYDVALREALPDECEGVEGVVASSPSASEKKISFLFYSTSPTHTWYSVNIWRKSEASQYDPRVGDVLRFRVQPQRYQPRGNPDEMDYGRWLWVQGIAGCINAEAGEVLRPVDAEDVRSAVSLWVRLRVKALQWRECMLVRLRSSEMPNDIAALLAAIALGDRSSVSPDMRTLFSEAGASHLMALSGLHLGIVTGLLLWLLHGVRFRRGWRFAAYALLLATVWTFALMAGLPTSLVRASLMMTFWIVASCFGRADSGMQHLTLAVITMLLLHPPFMFDVGAQLSCAAVAGILWGMPLLNGGFEKLCPQGLRRKFYRWHLVWAVKLLVVSFCAQVATLPFVVYYFNTFSPYAPLFNLIYIPLTFLLVISTFVLIAVAMVWTAGAVGMAGVLSSLVCFQLGVMRWQSSLPSAVVEVVPFHKAQPQLIVYNNRSCPAMHIVVSPGESYLLMPDAKRAEEGLAGIRQSFWKRRLTAEPVVLSNASMLTVYGKTVMMIKAPLQSVPATNASIDILWFCHGYKGSMNELNIRPRLVVLDASLSDYERMKLTAETASLGIVCYDIQKQGALQLSLPF
ncbi:MAG: ComEC/Rec2 family competence protein [Bacteroidaceae bacterium]|nr:ComEC/Rec2 family competence protein [Bacteroidaceae bacterium]